MVARRFCTSQMVLCQLEGSMVARRFCTSQMVLCQIDGSALDRRFCASQKVLCQIEGFFQIEGSVLDRRFSARQKVLCQIEGSVLDRMFCIDLKNFNFDLIMILRGFYRFKSVQTGHFHSSIQYLFIQNLLQNSILLYNIYISSNLLLKFSYEEKFSI